MRHEVAIVLEPCSQRTRKVRKNADARPVCAKLPRPCQNPFVPSQPEINLAIDHLSDQSVVELTSRGLGDGAPIFKSIQAGVVFDSMFPEGVQKCGGREIAGPGGFGDLFSRRMEADHASVIQDESPKTQRARSAPSAGCASRRVRISRTA